MDDDLTTRINKDREDHQFIEKILREGNWIGVKCDNFSHLVVRLREIADDVALIASFTGE